MLTDCHNYHREKAGLEPLRHVEEAFDEKRRRRYFLSDIAEGRKTQPAFKIVNETVQGETGKFFPEPPKQPLATLLGNCVEQWKNRFFYFPPPLNF